MQQRQPTYMRQSKQAETAVLYFPLPGLLLEGQKLALNAATRTLLLLSEGPEVLMAEQVSVNALRVITPILQAFPHYCPYEILLAHISSNSANEATIIRCRKRLQEAQDHGTWQQELRPIRRALSLLRGKLHSFGLDISTLRERGCSLTGMHGGLCLPDAIL